MSYIDCPNCDMKYHIKAGICPKCNLDRSAAEQTAQKRAEDKRIAEEKRQKNLETRQEKAYREEHNKIISQSICTYCGYMGDSTTITKGSLLIEIFLWCCFLIPGLIYSIWRHASRTNNGCYKCKNPSMIPVNSPKGKELLSQYHSDKYSKERLEQLVKQGFAYKVGQLTAEKFK